MHLWKQLKNYKKMSASLCIVALTIYCFTAHVYAASSNNSDPELDEELRIRTESTYLPDLPPEIEYQNDSESSVAEDPNDSTVSTDSTDSPVSTDSSEATNPDDESDTEVPVATDSNTHQSGDDSSIPNGTQPADDSSIVDVSTDTSEDITAGTPTPIPSKKPTPTVKPTVTPTAKPTVSPTPSPTPAVVNADVPNPVTYDTSYIYTNPILWNDTFSLSASGFKAIGPKLLVVDSSKGFGNYGTDGEKASLNIYDDTTLVSEVIGQLGEKAVFYSIADEDKEWRFIEAVDSEGQIIRGFCWGEYLKDAPVGTQVTNESAADIIKTTKVKYTKSFRYSIFTTQRELLKQIEPAGDGISRVQMVKYAQQFLGNPYVWGGESLTAGCDCSGFTMLIYRAFGIELPHASYEQAEMGAKIPASAALPGDLVFYARNGQIYHVMMVNDVDEDGNITVIHASSSTTGIIISSLNMEKACWACRFIQSTDIGDMNFKPMNTPEVWKIFDEDWLSKLEHEGLYEDWDMLLTDADEVEESESSTEFVADKVEESMS